MGKSLVSCFFDSRCSGNAPDCGVGSSFESHRLQLCLSCQQQAPHSYYIAYCYLMLIYPSTFWDSKMSISLRAE